MDIQHLDLEEQEQLDQFKHFWKQYGNLISWALVVVFGAIAAWNAYQYWQRSQAMKAANMFELVERAVAAGDSERVTRSFADMKDTLSRAVLTQQAGLMVARFHQSHQDATAAKAALVWVSESAGDEGYQALARLRLSALALDAQSFDEAMKYLEAPVPAPFQALVADRKGDVFLAQGKRDEATKEYLKAWAGWDDGQTYKLAVRVKLNALGVDPLAQPKTTEAGK
jgi:predicted negative regulator of RcsB-dependent stress response